MATSKETEYGKKWRAKNPEYDKEWRHKNKDKRRKYWLTWKKNHPKAYKDYRRRMRLKYGNSKGLRKRFRILRRDNYTCQYCGRKAPEVVLQVDHVEAKSKGGKYVEENLITSCRDCNIGKSNIF